MRISDWSSDVCSSDLQILAEQADDATARPLREIEHLEQRRLARTRGAGEEIEAARLKVEADVREYLGIGTIAQPNAVEFDHRAAGAHRGHVGHDVTPLRSCACTGPRNRGAGPLIRLPVARLSTEDKARVERGACNAANQRV